MSKAIASFESSLILRCCRTQWWAMQKVWQARRTSSTKSGNTNPCRALWQRSVQSKQNSARWIQPWKSFRQFGQICGRKFLVMSKSWGVRPCAGCKRRLSSRKVLPTASSRWAFWPLRSQSSKTVSSKTWMKSWTALVEGLQGWRGWTTSCAWGKSSWSRKMTHLLMMELWADLARPRELQVNSSSSKTYRTCFGTKQCRRCRSHLMNVSMRRMQRLLQMIKKHLWIEMIWRKGWAVSGIITIPCSTDPLVKSKSPRLLWSACRKLPGYESITMILASWTHCSSRTPSHSSLDSKLVLTASEIIWFVKTFGRVE